MIALVDEEGVPIERARCAIYHRNERSARCWCDRRSTGRNGNGNPDAGIRRRRQKRRSLKTYCQRKRTGGAQAHRTSAALRN